MKLYLLALALLLGVAYARIPAPPTVVGCPAAPSAPAQTDAWPVQVSETEWRTDVPGWVAAPAPACWKLGRVPLAYYNDAPEVLEQDPMPWAYGLDLPAETPCPATAVSCYTPVMPTPVEDSP